MTEVYYNTNASLSTTRGRHEVQKRTNTCKWDVKCQRSMYESNFEPKVSEPCECAPSTLIFIWSTYLLGAISKASLRDPQALQYATRNSLVNVQMDSVIRSTQGEEGIVLVVEDKSPKVFGKHCTKEKFDGLCRTGVLHMHSTESGLRSIFFKVHRYLLASLAFSCSFNVYCS
jgi:hypothetical protein